MLAKILGVLAVALLLVTIALFIQQKWTDYKCLNPSHAYETDDSVAAACKKNSWMGALRSAVE
ncbi:hypothetical protein [Burkholderia plantarii]|uniref:hypothetical protein n=1 Tax=Burkholderia plantarii TaxID=41899 RepID=UPI000A9B475E|nr:hypothetical protein [Burkholderia plantarii]